MGVSLSSRTQRILLGVLVVAAVGVAVAANWALLGYAQSSDSRVGRLSPKADLSAPAGPKGRSGSGTPVQPGGFERRPPQDTDD